MAAILLLATVPRRRRDDDAGRAGPGQHLPAAADPADGAAGSALPVDQAGLRRPRAAAGAARRGARGASTARARCRCRAGPGAVAFEHVWFGYGTGRGIARRRRSSGARRATRSPWSARPAPASRRIARLLFRFYDPSAGRILIDGHDLARPAPRRACARRSPWCRRTRCCSTTRIGYNIAFGRPDAHPAEIAAAAAAAELHELHRRVCRTATPRWSASVASSCPAARSSASRSPAPSSSGRGIFILDEATSALDSATEQAVQADLRGDLPRGHDHDRDRPSSVDDRRCRRDPGARSRPDRRARRRMPSCSGGPGSMPICGSARPKRRWVRSSSMDREPCPGRQPQACRLNRKAGSVP